MTCIVALIENGVSYFAGDSLVVNVPSQYHSNVSQTVRLEPKIWAKDGMLFGANGSVRMLQLLRYEHETPNYVPGRDKIKYLVSDFIPSLQACFEKNEYRTDGLDGSILLSLEEKLFVIGGEFNITDTSDGYDSVGKAQEVAVGSLYTTAQLDLPPLRRLQLALKATEHHTCVVSAPFLYITSGMEEAKILL